MTDPVIEQLAPLEYLGYYTSCWKRFSSDICDTWALVENLNRSAVTNKTAAQNMLTDLFEGRGKKSAKAYLEEREGLMETLGLRPELPDFSILPCGSWGFSFTFKLKKPYISRDDIDFYIIDNPVKKEWVFKLPYVAPSQWKGSLRHAAWDLGWDNEKDEQIIRIFGAPKEDGEDTAGSRGRLQCYPTFFPDIGMEIINRHDRQSGAGDKPVRIECVPENTEGRLVMLYVPFDSIGKPEKDVKKDAAADLELVARCTCAMLTQIGIGAKTSSGFGTALKEVKFGVLKFRGEPDDDIKTLEEFQDIVKGMKA